MSATVRVVVRSSRLASSIRSEVRNLPGDIPVTFWKTRVKWNLLNMAARAMSSNDKHSPKLLRIMEMARPTASSVDKLVPLGNSSGRFPPADVEPFSGRGMADHIHRVDADQC